jgi:hypothetical protein
VDLMTTLNPITEMTEESLFTEANISNLLDKTLGDTIESLDDML